MSSIGHCPFVKSDHADSHRSLIPLLRAPKFPYSQPKSLLLKLHLAKMSCSVKVAIFGANLRLIEADSYWLKVDIFNLLYIFGGRVVFTRQVSSMLDKIGSLSMWKLSVTLYTLHIDLQGTLIPVYAPLT